LSQKEKEKLSALIAKINQIHNKKAFKIDFEGFFVVKRFLLPTKQTQPQPSN
jgi:hypothetical protein